MLTEAKNLTSEAKEKVIKIKDILKQIAFRSYLRIYEKEKGGYWFSVHFEGIYDDFGFSYNLDDKGVEYVVKNLLKDNL